ncbi:sigma-54 interaction domain-containing protein [Alkaliphilus hydrothermalis]|uniref:Transcriptional regulator with PAS, ATPase and Fis domain n=1 Tax=Alkaliphilus hydrothermalis TaxID=1482730 RepID=A0ABS2NRD5_9FIRM|nr:sigma 54-interacting transcriptional regulator [Alkaliphilus hydrothermalis]MBM7615496.1 transcriptional regulator with PAS, ATPase and Fis domain [Alkaliphilus hydrothermalis]
MAKLFDIKKDVQHIAEAIASVMGVDVTIVDEDLRRVAGTGGYFESTGEKVDGNSVFRVVLETAVGYMIENPITDKICLKCGAKKHCREFGEVCAPINVKGKAVGVIGLIAFSQEQKNKLFADTDSLMEFLQRMADLIAVKLLEKEKNDHLQLTTKQLETVIDSLEEGIIAVDSFGDIIKFNNIAKKMFHNPSVEMGINIKSLAVNFAELIQLASKGVSIKNREFLYNNNNNLQLRGVASVNPVMVEEELVGLIFIVKNICQVLREVNDVIGSNVNSTSFENIVGESQQLLKVKEEAIKASSSPSTVLIQGESGTGKELFARGIHFSSPRSNKPFVAINCAAIPEQLLESELFGYEGGTFTGAAKGGRSGKFELANSGTIFLDEIGDMPLHLQSKLLRVLQEKKVDRIGSINPIPIDVRIIAATNKNLEEKVALGEFREDLFFRLNVIPINIPPLRERKQDIPVLMHYLLKKCNQKMDKDIKGFGEGVMRIFEEYTWKGNVRELENVIEYAVNMEQGEIIHIENLPTKLKNSNNEKVEPALDRSIIKLEELEKRAIKEALQICDSKDEAAQLLGIGRATLFRKIKQYRL